MPEKQINLATFHYWQQKQKRTTQNSFVLIQTSKSNSDIGNIEVVYSNDITVQLKHFDSNQINQLLKLA